MIENNQAWIDSNGELHVKAPDRHHEHPCRTRLSSGGPKAAMGLVDYTLRDERGSVRGFKKIYPEDRACFNQATNPGGWLIAVVSSAATAFMALAETGVFFH